jgi:hypothetical protein
MKSDLTSGPMARPALRISAQILYGGRPRPVGIWDSPDGPPAPPGRRLYRLREGNECKLQLGRNMPPRWSCVPRPWEREREAAGRVSVVGTKARVGKKIALQTELSDGARMCPQDQSQRVEGRTRFRNILRRGFANVLQLIPLCGTQPRSGEKRWRATAVQEAGAFTVMPGWREASWSAPVLWRFGRWCGGGFWWPCASTNSFSVDEFGERFPRVGAGGPSGTDRLSGADRQPGADGFESRRDSFSAPSGAA